MIEGRILKYKITNQNQNGDKQTKDGLMLNIFSKPSIIQISNFSSLSFDPIRLESTKKIHHVTIPHVNCGL